ncbi:hypothetical protein ABZ252_27690 [Streptomyces sp. NPDC006175]|uniref:hypothetical protein n=1 Tax=Streptomyces sp. NPDC006175 TaxID=3154471 RepID=UPI0033BCFB80
MRPHLTGRAFGPLLPVLSLVVGLLALPAGAAQAGPAPTGDRAATARAAAPRSRPTGSATCAAI